MIIIALQQQAVHPRRAAAAMSPPLLQTSVCGLQLDSCIYNASGPRTGSIEALEKIAQSASGAVLSKSATLVKQDGNPLPRFINKIDLGSGMCEGSVNSEGLPNSGIDYYISSEAMSAMKKYKKPYIVSLSGLSLKDNLEMIRRCNLVEEVDAIELNLACPNIVGKPIIAYDFDQMDAVLVEVGKIEGLKPLGVKLAPYFDMCHFERAAAVLAKHPFVRFIVTTNTIGNALFIDADNECAAIAPKGGFGGLGGGYVKQTALANVHMLYKLLRENGRGDIDVVGVGGVRSGRDAFEMILCGASAVQVGTCHWTEGPSCFARIESELKALMAAKGYSRLEDFRGKLKPYEKKAAAKKAAAVAVAAPGGAGGAYVLALHVVVVALAALVVRLGWADAQRYFSQ